MKKLILDKKIKKNKEKYEKDQILFAYIDKIY